LQSCTDAATTGPFERGERSVVRVVVVAATALAATTTAAATTAAAFATEAAATAATGTGAPGTATTTEATTTTTEAAAARGAAATTEATAAAATEAATIAAAEATTTAAASTSAAEAATAATEAAATTAATAAGTVFGFVHAQWATAEQSTIQLRDRSLGRLVRSHRHEREAACTTGLAIHHEVHVADLSNTLKCRTNIVCRRVERQIPHIQSLTHDALSLPAPHPCCCEPFRIQPRSAPKSSYPIRFIPPVERSPCPRAAAEDLSPAASTRRVA
jgi:hypothetical protein